MAKKIRRIGPIRKMAQRGFRGYPVATVAFYGPDDRRASKVAVGVIMGEDEDPAVMKRWFSDTADVRRDPAIGAEIVQFIKDNSAKSVGAYDGIIGCPHEEGVDYPEGEWCPQCPYWRGRNRFTGKFESEDR
jgi:hypothetical protein